MNVLKRFCFVVFLFKLVHSSNVQTAYVMYNISIPQCWKLPQPNICNITNNVVLVGDEMTGADLLSGTSYVLQAFQHANTSKSCIQNVRDTFCSGFLKCSSTDENIEDTFDFTATKRACSKAKEICGEEVPELTDSLDCAAIANLQHSVASYNKSCVSVESPPKDICQLSGYKALKPLVKDKDELMRQVLPFKNSTTPKCFRALQEVQCYILTPMCSDDEKHVISLISRQECIEKLSCLNTTNSRRSTIAAGLCGGFPDDDLDEKCPRPENLVLPGWMTENSHKHLSRRRLSKHVKHGKHLKKAWKKRNRKAKS